MTIKTLPSKVAYNPDSPIQLLESDLKKDGDSLGIHMKLANTSSQACISVLVEVRFLDSFTNYIREEAASYSIIDIYIPGGKTQDIGPIRIDPSLNMARSMEIRLDTLVFENNEILKLDQDKNTYYNEGRFSQEEKNQLTKGYSKDIITYGEHLSQNWKCVCGYINQLDHQACLLCKREKDTILSEYNKNKFKEKLSGGSNEIVAKEVQLEESSSGESSPKTGSKKKIVLPLALALGLALALILGLKINKNKTYANKLSTADKMLADGNYSQALGIYTELNQAKPSSELDQSISLVNELIQSEEEFKKGEEAIIANDYIAASNHFKNVSQKDQANIDKVSKHKETISQHIGDQANKLIKEAKYDEALDLLNGYLAVDPTDTSIGSLKNEIYDKREKEIKAEKEKIQAKEESIKDSEKKAETQTYLNNLAYRLQFSQTHISSAEANLRYGASIDSAVVKVLPKGSTVYIYDTVVEGTTRVWCDVEVIDANTGLYYYGWLSHKTIAH